MICRFCGQDVDESNGRAVGAHISSCRGASAQDEKSVRDSIPNVTWKRLSDGTYLVCNSCDDIDECHWHVAPDGTVLSVKEGGTYVYNRRQVRKNIASVTGIDLPLRWSGK